jgi:hypothetical protein
LQDGNLAAHSAVLWKLLAELELDLMVEDETQVLLLPGYTLAEVILLPVFQIRIRLDPNLIWAWIRAPDPYSESGFRIQMSKNRFKKPKFTMTDRKMLRLS